MIWVSYCTLRDGFRHRLIERAHRERVRLFVSAYILEELRKVLTEDLQRSRRFSSLARRAILRVARYVTIPPNVRPWVLGDPNDDPIVQTAVSAGADYLVTADTEVLKLEKVESVRIITASQFEKLLTSEASGT
jgi:putative PIN family toxin of toxin-antitoxin system